MLRLASLVLAMSALVACGGSKDGKKSDAPRKEDAPKTEPTPPPPAPTPTPQPGETRHQFASFNEWCLAAGLGSEEKAAVDALRAVVGAEKPCNEAEAALQSLTLVNLNGKGLKTLGPIAPLTGLRTVVAFGNPIDDLTPFADMTNLNGLHLDSGSFQTLAPLTNLARLELLSVGNAPISDLAPLIGMPNLRQLWAYRTQVKDLAPLARLAKLEKLHLWDDRIESLAPLTSLTALRDLALSGNAITDVGPLVGLENLTTLDVSFQKNLQSLAPLANLPATALSGVDAKTLFNGNKILRAESACPTQAGPEALKTLCAAHIAQ